eukprot:g2023.t1
MNSSIFSSLRVLNGVRTALGYRCMQRTHSTLRQLQTLQELEEEFEVKDTESLVSACNKTVDNPQQHNAFLHWIQNYVSFFETLTASECRQDALEFVQLANVLPENSDAKTLLNDVFCCLCEKIHWGRFGEEKLIEALSVFLLTAHYSAFDGNPHYLVSVARDVMTKLGSEVTFSKSTYPTLSVLLLALHHLCVVIHEVDPNQFDHNKQEGLYQEVNRCLGKIIDSRTYYHFFYLATITQQSLCSMDAYAGVSSKEILYRLFCAVRGTVYFYQALAGGLSMNIDLDKIEKGVKNWIEACTSHRVKQESWFDNVNLLIECRILAQQNPAKLELFQKCLQTLDEMQKKTKNSEELTSLRFSMFRQLYLMALEGSSRDARKWAAKELMHIGCQWMLDDDWTEYPEVKDTMWSAMVEVYQCPTLRETTIAYISMMIEKGFETECQKLENVAKMESDHQIGHHSLFIRIKKKLSLNESLPSRLQTQNMLKQYYQLYSEVPSLFDNEPAKHVNTLDHFLMLHEKVFSNTGQVQLVKRPIALEDLFKNRQLSHGSSSERVKRVLLFGNPGTGKTTVATKIAYKWSIEEWGVSFDALYLVPIRALQSTKYDNVSMRRERTLNDTMYETLRVEVENEIDKESTLVIFDGLDEGDEMAREMIQFTELKACRVLVLTRPQNLQSERKLANVEVECMGLSEGQLCQFIQLETSSTELVEHLQHYPTVWEVSHTPVVANILTFLYNTQKESFITEAFSINMFSIYWKMSLRIFERYANKTNSKVERARIFACLEKIAFIALADGKILIDQELVLEHSEDQEMKDILKDCGFLLLKKEGYFYQFPHLTFQEFFAAQYLVHSLMGSNEGRKRKALEFISENKYCASFRYMFCFMAQALTIKEGEKGYKDLEAIINDEPIALGYQQHLLLNLELLESSLATLKQQDREKLLNSTKVLEIGFHCIRQWKIKQEYEHVPHDVTNSMTSNPIFFAMLPLAKLDPTEKLTELFVKAAKVARYTLGGWKEVMKILNTDVSDNISPKEVLCIIPLMKAIPEKRESFLELYWTFFERQNTKIKLHLVSLFSDIARLMPNKVEQIFEKYKSEVVDDDEDYYIMTLIEQGPRLAKVMPKRWHQILEIMERHILDYRYKTLPLSLNPLVRLVELVSESETEVMEVVRRLFNDPDSDMKMSLAMFCSTLINGLPNNALEITQMLWTLCENDNSDVCDHAVSQVMRVMQSSGENTNIVVNALLKWSEKDIHSSSSSLVKIVAIAQKLIDKPLEGVDHILSNLGKDNLRQICLYIVVTLQYLIGTKTEKEMASFRLLIMCLKRLFQSKVDQSEQFMIIDVDIEDPEELAIQLAKLFICIEDSELLAGISRFLLKLAIYCPEYEKDLLDKIYKSTEDEDSFIAVVACITATSVLDRQPQDAERMMNKCLQLMHVEGFTYLLQMNNIVSLDVLLKTELLYTPVTIEARGNGPPQLIMQTTSSSKMTYTFRTDEEAKEFVSLVNVCTEVMFPGVASLVPKLEVPHTQRSKKSFFEKLRDNGGFYEPSTSGEDSKLIPEDSTPEDPGFIVRLFICLKVLCRLRRILFQFSKSPRDGHCVRTESSSETKIPHYRFKRTHLRYFVLSGVMVPWLHSKASLASDLVQQTVGEGAIGMEAEALDVGAVLLGDVALLIVAPLVIYAALRMIWEEQFEEPVTAMRKEDRLPSMHLIEGEYSTSLDTSDFSSRLADPFLQDLASRAAKNISKAAQEASDNCLFDANLHELVMKSEGRKNANQKWIYDMLSKQTMISKSELDQLNADLMNKSEVLDDEEICRLMTRRVAEKAAVKELQRLTSELMKRFCS